MSDAKLKSYAKEVSVVVTGRRLRAPGLFSLQIDDRHGAMLAVRHLIDIGHRKIAFITGSENHPDAVERFEGYKRALQDGGIGFDPKLVAVGDWHEEGGVRATLELLGSKVKIHGDYFASTTRRPMAPALALYRKGLSVPGDVSLVGFDDLPSSAYRLPPLTSVRQSIGELGDRSAQAVLQLIAGNDGRVWTLPRLSS